eukprot:13001667-Alexandrium_andersonii.AAC.1
MPLVNCRSCMPLGQTARLLPPCKAPIRWLEGQQHWPPSREAQGCPDAAAPTTPQGAQSATDPPPQGTA